MPRPRSYRAEGIVLRSSPLDEVGLTVTLYTREWGRLRAYVRGARKPTSKLVGHLEPLNTVELELIRSLTGGTDTITQAQSQESRADLRADLEAISRALYLAELVDGFGAEGSPNPDLYALLAESLDSLPAAPDRELLLRYFELQLLKCSGFMPELYACVACRKDIAPGRHLFSPDGGGTLCTLCRPAEVRVTPLSLEALKVLRFLDRAAAPLLARLHVDGALQNQLMLLLSMTITFWLDREIRSKRFIQHLERSTDGGVYVGVS